MLIYAPVASTGRRFRSALLLVAVGACVACLAALVSTQQMLPVTLPFAQMHAVLLEFAREAPAAGRCCAGLHACDVLVAGGVPGCPVLTATICVWWAQVEDAQSLALGGEPDQSRTAVVGDANIDTAWQGVWNRKPAAYGAVSRELAGYQDLAGTANTVPADAAVASGESILNVYSTVLGPPTAAPKPIDWAAERKKQLYDTFVLTGGKKAQLYDAATHNKELQGYSGVLAFNDKVPARAIDGPAGTAIKSSTDELHSYNSILDFRTAVPVFKNPKTKAVRSHKDVLTFEGDEQDAKQFKDREAKHHVLQPMAVAAEHDSYKNILTFPGDEEDAARVSTREYVHKVLDPSSLIAERKSHESILDFPHHDAHTARKPHADNVVPRQLVSKELNSYDSILAFPGQRQLNALRHPRESSKELSSYTDILTFYGHDASIHHKAAAAKTQTPTTHASRHAHPSAASPNAKTRSANTAAATTVVGKGGAGGKAGVVTGEESKKGQPTMLLDEALVQKSVEEEKAILIQPPDAAAKSPIERKLARLYQEAKELITEEHHTAKIPAKSTEKPAHARTHALNAPTNTLAKAMTRDVEHVRSRGRASRLWERRRKMSRDPILERLRRQAAELRERLAKVREEKTRSALEDESVSNVLSHKEKLLKLDESLEDKLTHKTTHIIHRADDSMTRMVQDDEQRLKELEVAQEKRERAAARRKQRDEGMQHLTEVQKRNLHLEREHALLLSKIHELRKSLPKSYKDGYVRGSGKNILAQGRAELRVEGPASTQELVQLNPSSSVLSSKDKLAYARKLAQAEQLLAQARTMADNIKKRGKADDVLKLDMDLEAIANVLKDRALHVVLDGESVDEVVHHQQLHELVNAAAAHADIVLGKSGKGSTGLEHVLQELRDTAEQHPNIHVLTKGRQQVLRALLAQEKDRKSRLWRAMSTLHKHTPKSVLQETEAALEQSGDYVQPLHVHPVKMSVHEHAHEEAHENAHEEAHARDGRRSARKDKQEWMKDVEMARNPALLSESSDSTDVLSMQGRVDENKKLKTDISALVDATQHKNVKLYDAMLKAAIKKSETKLAGFEAAQGSESSAVFSEMGSADRVFATNPVPKRGSAVRDAMAAAKRVEKQLHLKFDKKGSIYQLVKPRVSAAAALKHGKHYIPGVGTVHKDNGLIAALFRHHRVPVAQAEALEAPKLHKLSKRTHARLTNSGVFKAKGVRRHITSREPNAWKIVDKDADNAMAEGNDVGKDVAEVTGWAFKGLTSSADAHKASGDAKANSLWQYV